MTLTLSLAYLTVLAHQRNRQTQGEFLHAQTQVLQSLTRDPAPAHSSASLSRAVAGAALSEPHEPGLIQSAKTRWNEEIRTAVRWAQTKDWAETRETVEGVLGRLVGLSSGETTAAQEKGGVPAARETTAKSRDGVAIVKERARSALEETKAKSAEVVSVAGTKTEEVKSAVTKGVEKAKATAGLAEGDLFQPSDVEKALSQRYEKSNAMDKSVQDVLSERYRSVADRDNTKLRGI